MSERIRGALRNALYKLTYTTTTTTTTTTTYLWIGVSVHLCSRVLAFDALLTRHDMIEPIQLTVTEDVVEQLANAHHNEQLYDQHTHLYSLTV